MTEIEINGKSYPIKFGFGALYQFELKTGQKAFSVFNAMAADMENMSVVILVELFLSGFKNADPNTGMTESVLADALGQDGVLEALQNAFIQSMPQPDGSEKKKTAKVVK